MAIYSNSPTFSWISLTGIVVSKGEEVFTVSDFKTNLKYVYWEVENPHMLTSSNVMKDRSQTRFLVVVNDKGECILVPNEGISITFDGNSVESMSEHIWGLYEKDDEFTNKFVSIVQDIDGITNTVGTHTEELGKLSEDITRVEQTATSIDLSVKSLDKEFKDNKEAQALRENVNKSIIELNSALGLFKSKTNEYFKDNVISETERNEIQIHIDVLNTKTAKVVEHIETIKIMMASQNQVDKVTILDNIKVQLQTSVSNLISLMNTVTSDNTIVPSEITLIINAFAKCNTVVNDVKNTLDDMILLGAGGAISEELAKIGIKSDEISLKVESTKEEMTTAINEAKKELNTQITEVSTAVGDLETTMGDSFKDGVLSDAEKNSIKQNLQTLANEKVDIDKQYESVYANTNLVGDAKTNLKTSYDNYIHRYNNLVTVINGILNKVGNVDASDKADLDSAFGLHREALGDFTVKVNVAIDSIGKKTANDSASVVDTKYAEIILSEDGIVNKVEVLKNGVASNTSLINQTATTIRQEVTNGDKGLQSQINQNASEISMKVSAGNIASSINQTAQSVKINASKINLSGYATFTNLENEGETRIHGGNIRTDTIYVDRLNSNNPNPIIRLFSGGYYGADCSIDATRNNEVGQGDAIRLKWNRENYVMVNANQEVVFFLNGVVRGMVDYRGLTSNGNRVSVEGHMHNSYDLDCETDSMYFGNVNTGTSSRGSYMGGYIQTTGTCRADEGFVGMLRTSSPVFRGSIQCSSTSTVTPNVEYIGEGTVVGGICEVVLPSTVIGAGLSYNIQLTPIGNNPNIYVLEKRDSSFVVCGDDCTFDYIVKVRLPRMPERLKNKG